jgi:hypothetical protein
VSKHQRIQRVRGKADRCSRCGLTDPSATYHWANLTGNYDDIWDFSPMCAACHSAYDIATQPRGSAHGCAKLTEDIVRECRRRHAAGESARSLAREFGVSKVAMGNAVSARTWKHVGTGAPCLSSETSLAREPGAREAT